MEEPQSRMDIETSIVKDGTHGKKCKKIKFSKELDNESPRALKSNHEIESEPTRANTQTLSKIFRDTPFCILSEDQDSPCLRCVDFASVFFDSLYRKKPPSFTVPSWVHRHESFAAVVSVTQRNDNKPVEKATAIDAVVFAVCDCFTPVGSTKKSCCKFTLLRAILSIPTKSILRTRARRLVFELALLASNQMKSLYLRERNGFALLDGMSKSLHEFFMSNLIEQSESQENISTFKGSKYIEEHDEAIMIFKILSCLARQPGNHNILLAHSSLIRSSVLIAAHPLADEHILSGSLSFISYSRGYIAAAERVLPKNRLMESVISVMELCSGQLLTSLICPFYIPKNPDRYFLASLARIALDYMDTFQGKLENDPCSKRLIPVVVHILSMQPRNCFDAVIITEIAKLFAERSPHFALCEQGFVAAVVRMVRHVWAAQAARHTLRCLMKIDSEIHIPDDIRNVLIGTKCIDLDHP